MEIYKDEETFWREWNYQNWILKGKLTLPTFMPSRMGDIGSAPSHASEKRSFSWRMSKISPPTLNPSIRSSSRRDPTLKLR